MREAWHMHETGTPVAFLNFDDHDFDQPTAIEPVAPDRVFWQKLLSVAIGDLADLVSPREVVLVEGRPRTAGRQGNVEFDAKCYRAIFSDQRPQSGFVSVGGSNDVQADRLALGEGIQTLVPGASVIRLIDRDDRTDEEIEAIRQQQGGRVLEERDLENYLLDDEILTKLAVSSGKPELPTTIIAEKVRLLAQSEAAGKPRDDVKAIAGAYYNYLKPTLGLTRAGSNAPAFLAGTMAPLVTSDTEVYRRLEQIIFG